MFTERLAALPAHLRDFAPYPPAADRAAWSGLPKTVRAELIAGGEAVLGEAFPALSATDYLDFSRSGSRTAFEALYFGRRSMLNALVLAACAEGEGRFLDRIADGIWLLCEESGWQLPAHNSLERGGPRRPLPDPDYPVIDLFAAETGAQLAMIAFLLGDELKQRAPGIVARIDAELASRIFVPYLDRHFWWMGNGDEPMNNWTAWCTQNVLLAVFVRPTPQAMRHEVALKAAASLDAFLKDYGEDGACEEGVLYYRHAGLCLFNALTVLNAVAPGTFEPLWSEPKLRNVAEYPLRVHVADDRYFNFADCPAVAERCGAREFLFGRAVGSQPLMDFAAADWQAEGQAALPEEINLFYRVQAAFTAPTLAARRGTPQRPDDVFLASIGLFVACDDRFALAVKAGDNGDSHNHNDVGSVILYKDGAPVLIDVGVESYTKKTFSADRYDIWTMQSAFHNLPTFEGVMQREGERFASREVETAFGANEAAISMDIAGAYPPEAKVRSYRRAVRLLKGEGIEIADAFDGEAAAELSLMFAREPRPDGSRIVLPDLAEIALVGAGRMSIETIAIDDPRLRKAWPERLYRVLVPITGRALRIEIR